jgi:hypothetical protein
MAWDLSVLEGRDGALRHLIRHPDALWQFAHSLWAQLNEPKAYWVAQMSAAVGLSGGGKPALLKLMRLFLRERRAMLVRLGPEPNGPDDDPGALMGWDCRYLEAEHALAARWSAIIDVASHPAKAKKSAVIIRGPWPGTTQKRRR